MTKVITNKIVTSREQNNFLDNTRILAKELSLRLECIYNGSQLGFFCNDINYIVIIEGENSKVKAFCKIFDIKTIDVCDVCGSSDISEVPHMGKNCNTCHPLK